MLFLNLKGWIVAPIFGQIYNNTNKNYHPNYNIIICYTMICHKTLAAIKHWLFILNSKYE